MNNIGQRIKQTRMELGLNQGNTAILFDMNQSDFAKVETGITKNKFLTQFANFILKKKISPEKLFYMVTGEHYKDEEKHAENVAVPDKYVIQTKKHIQSLEEKIDELKHQRDYLEKALTIALEALKQKDSAVSAVTTKEDTHTDKGNTRQTVGNRLVGKNLKHSTTADP